MLVWVYAIPKINVDHIYIIPKAKGVKFIYPCSSFYQDFYNIHYFCLAKQLQNSTHSIIRKHLAKISWERNHPRQARNSRALPLAGQRNILENRNFFNLPHVSCCSDCTDLKLIQMPHIPKKPYSRNWRFQGTSGPLLREQPPF